MRRPRSAAEVAAAEANPPSTSAPSSSQPTPTAPIPLSGWRSEQVAKAVASLLKFVGAQAEATAGADLFADDEEVLHMIIALKRMPLQSRKDKPVPLPLPHPLYSPEGAEICLFVKDLEGEGQKSAKKRLASLEGNGGVTKVVGISKLRTKYESHEAKRQLCKLYDLFMADDRILRSLPKLIGKAFFKKKKQPIPINLRTKDWAAQVTKACACTYMFKSSGTSIDIKVARSSFSQQQVVDNIQAALAEAVQHVPKKWSNVQAVFLKTAESVALPLFQALPESALKIAA